MVAHKKSQDVWKSQKSQRFTYMFCPCVCFPGLQVAWLDVSFFKMLKPLAISTSSQREGVVSHVLPYPPYQAHL